MPEVADRARARGSATSPTALQRRDDDSVRRDSRTGRRRRSSGTPGRWSSARSPGKRVAALSGRAHFYEGHDLRTVTFATRVIGALGVQTLILTNAAGGINLTFKPGTLMLIDDHINLMGSNPLVGPNDERFGPRFPDMTEVYSQAPARARRRGGAARAASALAHGVYVGAARAELRDAGRDPLPADDRRRRRRHVDRARSDRRAPHGHGGARHLVHHQHGRRRAAAAARARRGDGGGAARPRASSPRCWRASLSDSDEPPKAGPAVERRTAPIAGPTQRRRSPTAAKRPRERRRTCDAGRDRARASAASGATAATRRRGSPCRSSSTSPSRLSPGRRCSPPRSSARDARAGALLAVQGGRRARDRATAQVITGCNIENATYGLTLCAERVALVKALSDGHAVFTRIAVVADTEAPTPPCGPCRQLLWEYCGDIEVISPT